MASFLSAIEKNRYLFYPTNGEIVQLFKFKQDIYSVFNHFLLQANTIYPQNCLNNGRNAKDQNFVYIENDKSNHCYLKVLGNDNHTVLIIRSDESNYEDYKELSGKKITESEFIDYLDLYQQAYMEQIQISPRFLREEVPPIDACEEMDIDLLINYYEFLNTEILGSLILFDEPINNGTNFYRAGYSAPNRKNNVIDYDQRFNELVKYNPFYIGRIEGMQTSIQYTYFLYEKDGFILAIIEPVLGRGYQYTLNLGNIDKTDTQLINNMLKAAMEADEKVVMQDPAIMRKNHTTFDTFKENLEIFLNSANKTAKFYYDVNKAKDVYR